MEKRYRNLHIQRLQSEGKSVKDIATEMNISRVLVGASKILQPVPINEDLKVKIKELRKSLKKLSKLEKEKNKKEFTIVAEQCEDEIRELLIIEPYNTELKEMLIEILILKKEYGEAQLLIDDVLVDEPQNLNVRFLLLHMNERRCYKESGKKEKEKIRNDIDKLKEELSQIAIILEKIVEEHLEYKEARYDLAKIYKKLKNTEKLIELLERIRAFDKNDIWCRRELAIIYDRQGDEEKKIAVLEEERQLSPDALSCRVILVKLYKSRGAIDNVIELQEEIRATFKDDVRSRLELVGLYSDKIKSGKISGEERENLRKRIVQIEDEVLSVEEEYRRKNPNDPSGRRFKLWLFVRYKARNNYDKYIEIGEELIEEDPTDERTIRGLIDVYTRKINGQGKNVDITLIDKLIELYKKLSELQPQDISWIEKRLEKIYRRKCENLQKEKFSKGESDLKEINKTLEDVLLEIIRIAPENIGARVSLCKVYMEQGRIKQAEEIISFCKSERTDVVDCKKHLDKIKASCLKNDINLDDELNDSQKISVCVISMEIMMDKYLREGALVIVRKLADEILKIDPENKAARAVVETVERPENKEIPVVGATSGITPDDTDDTGPGGNR